MQQDILALAIAAIAAAWLARTLARRLVAPPCRPPAAPGGGDGFVPLDALARPRAPAAGRGPRGGPPAQ
jgi:hypothetical protein